MATTFELTDFFESYAEALTNYDTKKMTLYYSLPCTFLSGEMATTFSEASKLEGLFNQGTGFYKQFGMVKAEAEVRHKRAITENIVQVKVRWKYSGADDAFFYDCDYEYLLKIDKHDDWKIEVVISINEKEQMEAWLKEIKKPATK